MITIASFLLLLLLPLSVSAQEQIGGKYYPACSPANGPALTIETDNHLRISVYASALIADEAYRTETQKFEGEPASMDVSLCDAKMENCKAVEGVLTAYKDDGDTIEAALEYFDGTETQGDAESLQGRMLHFTVQRDAEHPQPPCRQ